MLDGYTVGVTADRRWEEQASLFERRGATVVHGPAIRTLPLGSGSQLRAATEAVIARRPAVVIANTGIGVRSWFSAADTWGAGLGDDLHGALAAAQIFARGPKAAGAMLAAGLDVIAKAESERLCDAVDLALQAIVPGTLVALVLDGRPASVESARLQAAGAEVINVPVYRWTTPENPGPSIRLAEGVIAGRIQAVTFTAAPAIDNWMEILEAEGLASDLRTTVASGDVVVGCVGPVCTEAAERHGLATAGIAVPRNWRLGPLVKAVADSLERRTLSLKIGGAHVNVAGTMVTIDGSPVALTETEARVFSILARRPGVVHAKADLLRGAWPDDRADPHVVEVAVARVRRRLGPVGSHVATVYRRGYILNLN